MKNLIFVDCEATGPCLGRGEFTEFGAVEYSTRRTFRGVLFEATPRPENPAVSELTGKAYDPVEVFGDFERSRWSQDGHPKGDALTAFAGAVVEGGRRYPSGTNATMSISTKRSAGRRAAWMVVRAGGLCGKKVVYTSLKAAKSSRFCR